MNIVVHLDGRLLAYAIWGIGTVVVYGLVLRLGLRRWRYRRDARAWRELLERAARFLVALASLASLTLVLFGEAGTTARGLIVAIALGAFTAAGVIELREEPSDPESEDA